MSNLAQPVIVGAGPVGLGAALFLAKAGYMPRVVEMHKEPSTHSKALAVNPRTLTILEATGITQQMLALGSPIHGARFHRQGHVVAELPFHGIHPTYPFMLALSQATTERLLAQALVDAGGTIERGVKLVACRPVTGGSEANDRVAGSVEVTLEPTDGGSQEVVHCPWLLGADGAHSVARRQCNIPFVGSSFPEEWHLVDVP
ncbi:MAG: FAD-dependent monooxygenase, partial [Caldilineaceae bacterium]|nr:FAD-dependent monooxygenase [Caldilineaceae bacterium]